MASGDHEFCPLLIITSDQKEQCEDWLQSFKWYTAVIQLNTKDGKEQVVTFMATIGHEAQQIFKTFGLSEKEK